VSVIEKTPLIVTTSLKMSNYKFVHICVNIWNTLNIYVLKFLDFSTFFRNFRRDECL